MAIIPIWKDTKMSWLPVGEKVNYIISVDGAPIFNGRAYTLPNSIAAAININRIVRDYLTSKIDLTRDVYYYPQDGYRRTFEVTPANYGGESSFEFINDYSYEDGERAEVRVLSAPLSNVVDPRQLLFTTFANDGASAITPLALKTINGVASSNQLSRVDKCATYTIPLYNKEYTGVTAVTFGIKGNETMVTYKVKQTPARYCLYYLNAYGGFDHLLINGNDMRTDSMTRVEMTKDVGNTTLQHGRECISTEVTRKWRLYTDYLTDEQWALTHHLLGSQQVFLHNLESDEITPVVITSNVAEFRTYRNQGNKMSYLTIDVEDASKRIRK